jgi:hypothetical protein
MNDDFLFVENVRFALHPTVLFSLSVYYLCRFCVQCSAMDPERLDGVAKVSVGKINPWHNYTL